MTGKLRIFTVAEANAMLPRLKRLIARQYEYVRAIETTVHQWRQKQGTAAPDLRPDPADAPEVAAIKDELRGLVHAFRVAWEEVESTGAVVKDMREGLIDFYGERGGQAVWLCWRYGESAVSHWHPLDKGFAARQPLELHELVRALH